MENSKSNEFKQILEKFTVSGWDLISVPSKAWLEGKGNKDELTAAIKQADNECGSCGCEYDPLYKRALQILCKKDIKVSIPITNGFCPQTLFLYGTYKEDGSPNFGLFCWFSYCWDTEMGIMACIGGDKLTKDRIHATGIFSANLVTESILPLADYYGNTDGYSSDKMSIPVSVTKGSVLNVPILDNSPFSYELEVSKSIPLDHGEVFICKIRNVLVNEELADKSKSVEQRIQSIKPIHTTCSTYFSWYGKSIGRWSEPMKTLKK
ncbi:MAG: flavin reductase family protein [Ruminiclostridium sp.]|nr:flavin reductase family protein [Ruminiclostridium sp.]